MSQVVKKENSHSTASHTNPLTKKLSKVLDTRLDNDKEMVEVLKAVSSFYPTERNDIRARKNLRSHIEHRSLHLNQEFLNEFRTVIQLVDSVQADVSAMNKCCSEMSERLQAAKGQTRSLIDQTNDLQKASKTLNMKSEVVQIFLSRFQLANDEIRILSGANQLPESNLAFEKLHSDFFKVLNKARTIHKDCQILLRTQHQTAGLETMERTSLCLEAAYERLYRWTQHECRLLTMDSLDVSHLLISAFHALQERSILLGYALDEFGTARRMVVVRGFIDALTRGSTGGDSRGSTGALTRGSTGGSLSSPDSSQIMKYKNVADAQNLRSRPIELHSHDPLRYVGDMLAWIHQASASEAEQLYILLGNCPQASSSELIQRTLDHITEGMCHPFKMRLEQMLLSEPGPVVLYKLSMLLLFYKNRLSEMIPKSRLIRLEDSDSVASEGSCDTEKDDVQLVSRSTKPFTALSKDAALIKVLGDLRSLTRQMFLNSLTQRANKLKDRSDIPDCRTLKPSSELRSILALIEELLTTHDTALVPMEIKKDDYSHILSVLLDPLIKSCQISASLLQDPGRLDVNILSAQSEEAGVSVAVAVYLINCLYSIEIRLALYEFTDDRIEMLKAQQDAHIDALVNEQAAYVLHSVGLSHAYGTISTRNQIRDEVDSLIPLSQVHSLDRDTIKQAMSAFDEYLASPDSCILPALTLVLSANIREVIHDRAALLLVDAYSMIYREITNPFNGYSSTSGIVPRTPKQVEKLLT